MESLHYLILVNLYLLLFYGFYHVLLRHETFFRLNRLYLVGTAIISFLIPFIQLDWIKSLFITDKVQEVTFIYGMMVTPAFTATEQAITAGDIVALIYLTGLAVFLIQFIIRLINIRIHLNKRNTGEAFSFFKHIKVDSKLAHRNVIMEHEQVHANHYHSADIILFELIAIINWFNPVVYFYKKAIKNIHEFTADEVAASYADSKNNYSMILLSKAFGVEPHQLTNSFFNQSLLKQRIYMLNKNKSKKAAILKYGLSAPLFAVMLILSSATVKEKVEESKQIAKLEPRNLSETVAAAIPESIKNLVLETPSLADTAESVRDIASVEVMPQFPGGHEAFVKYIGKNFTYSSEAKRHGLSGKVIIAFVVEKDGNLTNIKVLRDMGLGTGSEAARVLTESPKWTPGKQKGKFVRVAFTLPIALNINGSEPRSGNDKNTIYILDGKEITDDEYNAINIGDIKATHMDLRVNNYGERGKHGVINVYVNTTPPKEVSVSPVDNKSTTNLSKTPPLIIFDGKELDDSNGDAIKRIDPNEIGTIYVLDGDDAIKKYGEKAKDGVIVIMKNNSSDFLAVGNPKQMTIKPGFKGLIFINGKQAENNKGYVLSSLKKEDIISMNVLNDKSATDKYGDKGKDGVIEIAVKTSAAALQQPGHKAKD